MHQDLKTRLNPEIYKSNNYLVFDFETTNLDKGSALRQDNRIVCATWTCGPMHHQRGTHSYEMDRALKVLEEAISSADFIVAHHAKFELQWLKRLNIPLESLPPVYDTMLGEYVLAGNRGWKLGLQDTASRYGITGKKFFISALMSMGVCPSQMPREALKEYNIQDVKVTHEIFLRQRQLLADAGLLPVFLCRNLMVPVLADIEFNGMQLDEQRVKDTFDRLSKDFSEVSTTLGELSPGLNWRSQKQLAGYLYDVLGFEELKRRDGKPERTPAGGRRTDGESIRLLTARTSGQKEFKEVFGRYSDLKVLDNVITKLKACTTDDNGRLFARISQAITQTHRFASQGGKYKVQFQNFPRDFKKLFRARAKGWRMVEADAPQLEFRCAIDMGHDEVGLADVCQGVDVHKLTQDVIGVDRTSAKPYTFKPLYGGDSGTPKERAYYKAFREKYGDTYSTQTQWTYDVLGSKSLRIPSGLIFYWPDCSMDNRGYIKHKASIFNYPIQSFATADIIPLTLWLVWYELWFRGLKAFIVNTIHDSIIAEVPEEEIEAYKQILIQAFTEDIYQALKLLYNYDFKVPLGVGIKASEFWGDTKEEEKYDSQSRLAAYRGQTILQSN